MADPVTLAVVGATAGAAMSPKDPLKGALLGAAGGYGGGAALGAMGGTAAAGTAAGTAGAASVPGTAALTLGGGTGLAAPTMTGLGLAPAATGLTAGQAGLAASGSMLGSSLGAGATSAGMGGLSSWIGQNPYLANMAMSTGMNALTPPPAPPSGGLIAGRPQEIDMMSGMPTQPFMQQRKLSLL